MKISVIIPVFNAENFLFRAIESVLIQPEVTELILVDDGSTDSSLQICRQQAEVDKRILILQHPGNKNKGVSATRNLGIQKASEPFIAFLDADDYYLPLRFSATSLCFEEDETVDGVYEMIGVHSISGIINYSEIQDVQPGKLFENLQPLGNKLWFSIDGLTVKKTIFNKAGFFDETLKTSEDTLQWFKMAAVAKLVPGNIRFPVTIAERGFISLTSNSKLVEKNFELMWFKLFEYCKMVHLVNSRKDMVLSSLFFHLAQINRNGINKMHLVLRIIIADPGYVFFHSNAFRRYAGNMIGYNQMLRFLTRIIRTGTKGISFL
ncbi:glycosyltransferase family A protein [Ferruginibacter paludis]|uniref:glycosyltransferase family 2 protein n=1 Tax=Ferruginibacter paludis TaxID=1310417 RepID=UPI0025B3A455|nr:glycosyltransferase family A protein [Ferruginibacter paludis]MDN3655875.1 glycosyltransferase family A protein [Ferruginibacter paludis]